MKSFTLEDGILSEPIDVSIKNTECIPDQGQGLIELTVTGGTPPYTYRVFFSDGNQTQIFTKNEPSFDIDLVGNYYISVIDVNGCLGGDNDDNVFINTCECPNISITPNLNIQNPTTCNLNGGSVTWARVGTNVMGATPPYNYFIENPEGERFPLSTSLSSFVDGLSQGTHKLVIVDANDCEGEADFEIGLDDDLIVYGEFIKKECEDLCNGEISFAIEGGSNNPDNYEIDIQYLGNSQDNMQDCNPIIDSED
jgi:hypothetical protein